MKKTINFLFFLGIVVLSTSCKRDYTCECSITDGSGNSQTITVEYKEVSRRDAKEACSNYQVQGAIMNECVLK